jgi:Outer membrane protein beta-barrel domain
MRQLHLTAMLLLLCVGQAVGQSPWQWGLRAGVMLGGPIPASSDPDSSSGNLAVGPSGGVFVQYAVSERWRIQAGLAYAFKGATYQQLYRNDTLMPLQIFPGLIDTVPTYYYADASGEMQLHYLDLPILVQWRAAKGMWVQFGPYLSGLIGGKDAGKANIQIGDGLLFPDTTITFDNFQEIRRLDMGICLGGSYELENGLFFEMRAQRSLRGLYRKGFLASQGLPEIPLYHTQFYLGLGWRF